MSQTDPLTEFDSLAEALDAIFARALNLTGPNDLVPLVNGAQKLLLQLRRQPPLIQAEICVIDRHAQGDPPPLEHQDTLAAVRSELDSRRKACEAALRRAERLIRGHEANLRSLEARLEEEIRRIQPTRKTGRPKQAPSPSRRRPLPHHNRTRRECRHSRGGRGLARR